MTGRTDTTQRGHPYHQGCRNNGTIFLYPNMAKNNCDVDMLLVMMNEDDDDGDDGNQALLSHKLVHCPF